MASVPTDHSYMHAAAMLRWKRDYTKAKAALKTREPCKQQQTYLSGELHLVFAALFFGVAICFSLSTLFYNSI